MSWSTGVYKPVAKAEADAAIEQGLQQCWLREAQAGSATEDHEFGLVVQQAVEVGLRQLVEAARCPGAHRARPRHDETARVRLIAHPDARTLVARDRVGAVEEIWLEFHVARWPVRRASSPGADTARLNKVAMVKL